MSRSVGIVEKVVFVVYEQVVSLLLRKTDTHYVYTYYTFFYQNSVIFYKLCGALETPSAGGVKYFITFIDDYSHKMYVYFLKNKMDIKSVFQKFKEEVENELEKKTKIVRSDRKEYCNKEFSNFLIAA
ncbi:unnamed protein product [Euphydryas editha]|uniref:Integrase catalytic domain-containing protein n=1 Tax=Euphydryas editha TaxID=104508 RepID=A0AAU9TFA1_EUPED|nr:unnamed protein product [Euphydryas editha]